MLCITSSTLKLSGSITSEGMSGSGDCTLGPCDISVKGSTAEDATSCGGASCTFGVFKIGFECCPDGSCKTCTKIAMFGFGSGGGSCYGGSFKCPGAPTSGDPSGPQ